MSDSKPFDAGAWSDGWMDAQRKYWDAWLNLSRASMESGPTGGAQRSTSATPWAGALDEWWKSVSRSATPDAREFYDRMMGLSRGYFAMAEGLMHQHGEHAATDALRSWLDQFTDTLRGLGSATPDKDAHLKDVMSFWQLPMDTWQRVASSVAPLPGDMWRALRPEGAAAFGPGMQEHLDRFLSVPGVGYARESQEQYQSLTRRILEYQRAYQAYEAGLAKVALDSADRFRARLDDASRRDTPIKSMRELFNEWVDVCEEVYGEYAMSEEHARTYGEMVNALMAVKHEGSRLVDEMLEGLNMPTRREISTLHQRFQESRREIRNLRWEIEGLKAAHSGHGTESVDKPPAPARKAPSKARTAKSGKTPGTARAGARKTTTRRS